MGVNEACNVQHALCTWRYWYYEVWYCTWMYGKAALRSNVDMTAKRTGSSGWRWAKSFRTAARNAAKLLA